jgi:hypothetical protein
MTITELAAHNAADRRRRIEAAIAEERRGLAIRARQSGRVDAIVRNIARLEDELAALPQAVA